MRRASTLASSALGRALLPAHDGCAAVQNRLLQAALYGTTSSSSARRRWFSTTLCSISGRSARVASVGLAGALVYVAGATSFFGEVKAFLDYYKIPYKVVEVNPISKKEIKWSDYKKVPILVVDGEELVDSSAIIDKLGSRILPGKSIDSVSDDNEEKKWRQWVDNHLVHILSPNIYRNTSEALESFDYITSNGNFSFTEKITVKYAGAAAMYFVSKNLKKKYNITDERASLYEAAETWVDALDGREFLGGSKPNLADLAVFGVLRPIRYLRSGRDMVEHTRIGEWYARMESAVGESSRIKAA
ncbi:hypothetical protein F0562_023980 [Nyssa sinensis]|uniref:GST N-terminal domain-containing protein n=1 Tax=Nyssa sinensis TaxID=561372 RepID=A0A5J5BJN4_9ASTE|nr:hypothetical protein F0562_023980 [Nyssa sinensis]